MAYHKQQYELEGYFHFTDVHKFLKDLAFISKILTSLCAEIADYGSSKNLKKILSDEEQTLIDEERLLEEARIKRRQINILRTKLMNEKQENRKLLEERRKEAHKIRQHLSVVRGT